MNSNSPPNNDCGDGAVKYDSDKTDQPSKNGKLWDKLSENVDLEHAYIPLLACCFVSGLTDGTIYNGEQQLEFIRASKLAHGSRLWLLM